MEHTQSIIASPCFSFITGADKREWASMIFQSPHEGHAFSMRYARTPGQSGGSETDPSWAGLGDKQTRDDFDRSGIAEYSKSLVLGSNAKLPPSTRRPHRVLPAVCGAQWSIPAVLANLPLSALTRARTKLPPVSIRLAFFMSAGITAESMAPLTARIARAIWDYTMEGGAVSLSIFHTSGVRSQHCSGILSETKVQTSDIAGLSLALSPAYYRAVFLPLMKAFSDDLYDSGAVVRTNPVPNSNWIGGPMRDAIIAAEAVIQALRIV